MTDELEPTHEANDTNVNEGASETVILEKKNDFVSVRATLSPDKLKLFVDCERVALGFKIEDAEANKENQTFENSQENKDGKSQELEAVNHVVTPTEIMELLQSKIDEHLIDRDMITRIAKEVDSGAAIKNRRIAKGTPIKEGKDGKLVLLVKKYQNDQSGFEHSANIRELHFFDNIQVGQTVAKIFPPEESEDGVDALGKPLKAPKTQKAKVTVDKTLKRETNPSDGIEIITAEVAGYLIEESGKLKIIDHLNLPNHVDFKTGNIDFIGSVSVTGSILKDFKVIAQKNIVIHGDIEGGFALSPEATVTVKGNVVGHGFHGNLSTGEANDNKTNSEPPAIRAGGGIIAKAICGARIESNGDIQVEKEIVSSLVKTSKSIRVPTGQIVGGVLYASHGVEAAVIGVSHGSQNQIVLCSEFETSSHYSTVIQSIASHKEALNLLTLQLGPIADKPEILSTLQGPQAKKVNMLLQKLTQVKQSLESLIETRDRMQKEATRNRFVRVNFHKLCFPGTEIHAQGKKFLVEQVMHGPKSIAFDTEQKTFSVGELKPLEALEETDKDNESKESNN